MSNWNIFSNHGHVLLYLAREPGARLRDVAANVGITERAVQKIVRDMQDAGVVSVSKVGRRNRYAIDADAALRHRLEAHCTIGQVVDIVLHTPGVVEPEHGHDRPLLPQVEPAAAQAAKPAAAPPAASPAPQAEAVASPTRPGPETSPDKSGKPRKGKKSEPDAPTAEQGSLF